MAISKRKGLIIAGTISLLLFYFTFFNIPSSENILLQNSKSYSSNVTARVQTELHLSGDLQSSVTDVISNDIPQVRVNNSSKSDVPASVVIFPQFKDADRYIVRSTQMTLWNSWLQDMKYLSAGKYFTHCDDGIQIGEIVLIPSKDSNYGIKIMSFLNVTLAEAVFTGKADVEISYNDIKFWRRTYELCRRLKKVLPCPINKGQHRIVSEFKLPFFILKGKYDLKVRSEDSKGQALGCLMASVVI